MTSGEAIIYGLAIGDALGYPVEFLSREEIRSRGDVSTLGPGGLFSDDTQMSLAIAMALIDCGHLPSYVLQVAIAHRFVEWYQSPENNRAPGGTCMEACRRLATGSSWEVSGVTHSKGCGAVMRVAPIGFYYENHRRVVTEARASASITHKHPAAIHAAAGFAMAIRLALEGAGPGVICEAARFVCSGMSEDLDGAFVAFARFRDAPPDEALHRDGLGEAWVAESALVSALYCHHMHPNDYERAVLTAANTSGDSDTIACMTGALSAASGNPIPADWIHRVESSDKLGAIGRALEEKAQR